MNYDLAGKLQNCQGRPGPEADEHRVASCSYQNVLG